MYHNDDDGDASIGLHDSVGVCNCAAIDPRKAVFEAYASLEQNRANIADLLMIREQDTPSKRKTNDPAKAQP